MNRLTSLPPWLYPEFDGWSIVRMNHYHVNGKRYLFVAMTKNGVFTNPYTCIQAEGIESPRIWEELAEAIHTHRERTYSTEPKDTDHG